MIILASVICIALSAKEISSTQATRFAEFKLQELYPDLQLGTYEPIQSGEQLLAYLYRLQPTGYLVVSALEELPPLLAYSGSSDYPQASFADPLTDMIIADLTNRLQAPEEAMRNSLAWQDAYRKSRLEQWPPAGYSPTEGWVKTLWTQSAPYNQMCPMDLVTQQRSVAGCPAIAMGQIVAYHQALNGTRLTDADDYHHNYGGRNYWIDDDFASLGFPSFPQTNGYLDQINTRFRYDQQLSDSLKAALVFACGTALTQVYSSAGSGTFGVSQALAAFQRFNYAEAELLVETSPNLYPRIMENVKQALPVHLAVVTPAWDSGHNVVIDGYNSDNFYHLNFGWGGSYNGWYLLPTQMPYGLTVVEGAIINIKPYQYLFTVPDTLQVHDNNIYTLELINLHNEPVILEAIVPQQYMQNSQWQISPSQALPATIPVNGMMSIDVQYISLDRPLLQTCFRLVLDQGFTDVPVSFNTSLDAEDDFALPAPLSAQAYPNPFAQDCRFRLCNSKNAPTSLEVFNLKGQLVYRQNNTELAGAAELIWPGKDSRGQNSPSGLYLYRLNTKDSSVCGKILKMNK